METNAARYQAGGAGTQTPCSRNRTGAREVGESCGCGACVALAPKEMIGVVSPGALNTAFVLFSFRFCFFCFHSRLLTAPTNSTSDRGNQRKMYY